MYDKLKELNLEEYIKKMCGGTMHQDKYFDALENFVANISLDNFQVLKNKFKGQKPNSEITDLLREVEVACAFHPKANFSVEGPDLENGVFIEVKMLNESKEERERHASDSFFATSRILSEEEKIKERNLIINAINNKITYHLETANKQLKGKGLIYLIWDYDNFLHGEDGQVHGKILDENEMPILVEGMIEKFVESHPCLVIKNYYFGDLIARIAGPNA